MHFYIPKTYKKWRIDVYDRADGMWNCYSTEGLRGFMEKHARSKTMTWAFVDHAFTTKLLKFLYPIPKD